MERHVAVVTDSTSYLPTQWAVDNQITKVPVQVIVSGQAFREGVDISTAEVARALRDWLPVSTSRPSPVDFVNAYEQAAASGVDHIISAHLSAELSGTYQTALLAAKDSPVPVTVIDSRTLAMGLGFACLTGAELAEAGAEAEEVAAAVTSRARRSNTYFYVDSLEYLKRGGRIGKASAAIGAALRVKPILGVRDGRVELLEKARTPSKALARLLEISVAAAKADDGDVDVAVQHIDAPERADEIAEQISVALGGKDIVRIEIGAVVGAHVGPGCVAVTIAPKPWSQT
ncbi:MAG TPA: fatty acid-binding protein DegV [Actinobacteria bacterium]|jgi:DegV family protein with EDD domain|nr:fatty acid-binding protein DegV [Actinomycetota bacterium]